MRRRCIAAPTPFGSCRSGGAAPATPGENTYASFMIGAGVNATALAQYMGHSSIKLTFDL